MKKFIVGAGIVLMLTGCAGARYVNPSVSQAQAQRDFQECHYEAQRSVNVPYGGNTMMVIGAAIQINDLRAMCMNLRGYHAE